MRSPIVTAFIPVSKDSPLLAILFIADEFREAQKSVIVGAKHYTDDIPRLARLRVTTETSPAIFHHAQEKIHPDIFSWPFN